MRLLPRYTVAYTLPLGPTASGSRGTHTRHEIRSTAPSLWRAAHPIHFTPHTTHCSHAMRGVLLMPWCCTPQCPFQSFLTGPMLMDGWQVNKLGFFAQVGPLQVFVSKHLIPADMLFDAQSNPASYVSQVTDQQPQRITKDSEVRLRIVATRVDSAEIFAIGTIKDEYLGLIE